MENNLGIVHNTVKVKSILTSFGDSVRFGRPPMIGRSRFLGAWLDRSSGAPVPMVAFESDGAGRRDVRFDALVPGDRKAVHDVLNRCLTPENIRLTVGDVIRVNRLEDPFYGIIMNTEGIVLHVDSRGAVVSDVPVIVLFGTDDFDIVGHEEFTKGIFDVDTPDYYYRELCTDVSNGNRCPVFCKRWPYPGGGSAFEKVAGSELGKGTVVEYCGIEALVRKDGEGKWNVHCCYAFKDEDGNIRFIN